MLVFLAFVFFIIILAQMSSFLSINIVFECYGFNAFCLNFLMNSISKDDKLLAAQQQFEAILATFSTVDSDKDDDDKQQRQKEQFLQWLRRRIRRENVSSTVMPTDDKRHSNVAVRHQLGQIAKRLRELTPLEYCLDLPDVDDEKQQLQPNHQHCPLSQTTTPLASEVGGGGSSTKQHNLVWPVSGAFADCTPHNTLHVDAFLYDDDDVDQMAADGILRRHFCRKCRSTDVAQFNLISHSLAIDELDHLFTVRLPSLDGKVLVDIGSRLGTVLYAAALYCPKIGRAIGIERDPRLYELQCQIVAEFGNCMSSRVELRCADVRDIGTEKDAHFDADNVLACADVVIMNNVFTFFADHAEQVSCWKHLRVHLRPGTLLLHSPSLELVTAHLSPSSLGFAFNDWLQTLHIGTAANSTAVSVGTDTFSVYQIAFDK